MKAIKVQSTKTLPYGKFNKGTNVATGREQKISYWTGRNDIRHHDGSYFICIAGTDQKKGFGRNSQVFVERVYKIDSKTFEENRQWLINNIDDLIEHDGQIARYSEVMGFVDNE